jgi:hypothetical protein
MNEVLELLQRQANWQKSRKRLSWPEKIRMAEAIHDSVAHLRIRNGCAIHHENPLAGPDSSKPH